MSSSFLLIDRELLGGYLIDTVRLLNDFFPVGIGLKRHQIDGPRMDELTTKGEKAWRSIANILDE